LIKITIRRGFTEFFNLHGYTSTTELTIWIIFEALCWLLLLSLVTTLITLSDAVEKQPSTPIMWVGVVVFWVGSALLAIGAFTSSYRWRQRNSRSRFVQISVGLLTGYKCPCGHEGIDFMPHRNSGRSAQAIACPKCLRLGDENTLQILPRMKGTT